MKTQTELLEELDHLKAEERWDDALKLLDLIEPVSDEEWFQELAGVPIDDEPLSAEDRRTWTRRMPRSIGELSPPGQVW